MNKKTFALLFAATVISLVISLSVAYLIHSVMTASASPIDQPLPVARKVEMLTSAVLDGLSVEGEQSLAQQTTCLSSDDVNYFCPITASSGNEYQAMVTLETIDDVTFALPAELELTREIEVEL